MGSSRDDSRYRLMSSPQDDGSDNEGIEFENYAESDDDDEDPYFMAVHRKKSRTFSYKWLTCSPTQLIRFMVPATCVLIITIYTITIAVLVDQRRSRLPGPYLSERYVGAPPSAKQVAWSRTLHGDITADPYHWLSDIAVNPDVLRYIWAERNYTHLTMQPTRMLQEVLVKDMRAAGKATWFQAGTVIARAFWEQGEHVYWVEYQEEKSFPVYKRQKATSFADVGKPSSSPVETVLDTNILEKNGEPIMFMHVGAFEVSADGNMLSFSVDFEGDEQYSLYVKDLRTDGATLSKIAEGHNKLRWAQIGGRDYVYYSSLSVLGMPKWVYRYCAANCQNGDKKLELVYEELDQSMVVELSITSDGNYLLLKISNEVTSETRYIDLVKADTTTDFTVLYPRSHNIQYDVQHRNGQFYVRSNRDDARNFKIIRTPVQDKNSVPETIIVPHSDAQSIERMELFADHMVLWVLEDGLRSIIVVDLDPDDADSNEAPLHSLKFDAQVYSLMPGTLARDDERLHRRFNAIGFTFTNSSFLSPPTVWEYNMAERETRLLARAADGSRANAAEYTEKRIYVPVSSSSAEYTTVSIVAKTASLSVSPPSPLLLAVDGARGDPQMSGFDPALFSLLDRGVTVAIVNPWTSRERWRGRAVVEVRRVLGELVKTGYAERGRIAVYARGENGIIAGNAITRWGHVSLNESTSISGEDDDRLVRVVIAEGPLLDVINNMLNDSLPWVAYERSEWGDPNNKTIYDSMLSFSPYDQIHDKRFYPAALITSGLTNARIQYHDATKFVAKIRKHKQNDPGCHGPPREEETANNVKVSALDASVGCTPLLLQVGEYGRLTSEARDGGLKERAFWYAFVLDQLGVVNTKAKMNG